MLKKVFRSVTHVGVFVGLLAGTAAPASGQAESELLAFFKDSIKLSADEIASIRSGQAVAKALESRTPAEIFVVGAVYIRATPESYVKLAGDLDRLRKLSQYLAVGKFSNPPQASDLKGFTLSEDDIKSLKKCKPGDCEIQMPAGRMIEVQKAINWSAPDVNPQVNQHLQKATVELLMAYRNRGNQALGEYHDRKKPTAVAEQFRYILSYAKAMPKYAPELHRYLLDYPAARPAGTENVFRWENVKFGLKPTLRVVHVVTMRGNRPDQPAYVIAGKQLYSSHYFETALDLAFCIRGGNPRQPGFYLVMAMGSQQAGLTGIKGSILRKVAVSRTASSLQNSLNGIKSTLENSP